MIKKILKYLKILYRGMIGIGVELVYPFIILFFASLICSIFYLSNILKK